MNTKTMLTFLAGAATSAAVATLLAVGPDHGDTGDLHHADQEHTDHHKADAHAMEPMEMDMEEMWAMYEALGEPGEHHEEMMKTVGSWSALASFNMDPDAPPQISEGHCTVVPVMGGRFFKTTFEMDFMGEPFRGLGYNGYDNGREHFVGVWMDSISTQISHQTGHMDDEGVLTMKGMNFVPGMGETGMKIVDTWINEDTWKQEFYDEMPDGSWMHSGTIIFTRD